MDDFPKDLLWRLERFWRELLLIGPGGPVHRPARAALAMAPRGDGRMPFWFPPICDGKVGDPANGAVAAASRGPAQRPLADVNRSPNADGACARREAANLLARAAGLAGHASPVSLASPAPRPVPQARQGRVR